MTLEEAPPDALALAPFAYGGAIAEAVRRAKFRPDERPARVLAKLFAQEVSHRWPELAHDVDVITWVPLHAKRLRARGFDLSALLASRLSREVSVPCRSLLTCTRHDPPLSHGADVEERARRVRQRYRTAEGASGVRVLLIDDVVTTGATLAEAVRVLTDAGALEVTPLTLAATPSWSKQKRAERDQEAAGSPVQSLPRNIWPHMRKSASSDQSG